MNDDIVVHVDNLGKCFKLYPSPWHRVLEWARFSKHTYHQPFWALKEISFKLRRGEFLGVIGQNGAGKSTLLKILTGVLQPTTGTYRVTGKVLSLFGLSANFNLDLSGKENIVRSAELLDFPSGYVQKRMEQIAEFAELEDFFEHPVKVYSAGMRTRLAFSLFAFLDCDILILDEVLAPGDIFFKQKCYARLEELIAKQTTIILVTHAMSVVRQYCRNVLLLNRGEQLYQGDSKRGVQKYFQVKRGNLSARILPPIPDSDDEFESLLYPDDKIFWPSDDAFSSITSSSSDKAKLVRYAICNEKGESCTNFTQGAQAFFYCDFQVYQTIGFPIISILLTNQFNVLIHAKNSLCSETYPPRRVEQTEQIRFCHRLTLGVEPGHYVFGVILSTLHPDDYDCLSDPTEEDINQKVVHLYRLDQVGDFRVIPYEKQPLKRLFWGLCDLTGDSHIQIV